MGKIAPRTVDVPGRTLDVAQADALVLKAQQLAGHFPDDEALERGRRILLGEITPDEARAELAAKYRDG